MSERGMKKWAPYKSLIEQEKYLKKASQNNEKQVRPQISSDAAEEINEILVNYHGEEVEISYWRNEKINTISTILSKIDSVNKKIVLSERRTIYFKELISIKRKD
ncbi:MAG: YolD-like family protein [Bacilli bacterium]|nr:YolD-like family protein [Bacilli bacterium]